MFLPRQFKLLKVSSSIQPRPFSDRIRSKYLLSGYYPLRPLTLAWRLGNHLNQPLGQGLFNINLKLLLEYKESGSKPITKRPFYLQARQSDNTRKNINSVTKPAVLKQLISVPKTNTDSNRGKIVLSLPNNSAARELNYLRQPDYSKTTPNEKLANNLHLIYNSKSKGNLTPLLTILMRASEERYKFDRNGLYPRAENIRQARERSPWIIKPVNNRKWFDLRTIIPESRKNLPNINSKIRSWLIEHENNSKVRSFHLYPGVFGVKREHRHVRPNSKITAKQKHFLQKATLIQGPTMLGQGYDIRMLNRTPLPSWINHGYVELPSKNRGAQPLAVYYTKTTRSSRKSKTIQPVGQAMVAPKTQNRQKYIAPSSVTVNPLVQEINSKRNQTVLPKVSRIPGNTLQLQRKKLELKPSPSPQYHLGKSVFTILMSEPLISLVKSTIRRKKEETAKPEVTPKVGLIKNSLTHLTSVMPGKIMRKTAQAGTSSRRNRQSRLGSAHPSQVIPNLTLVLLNQKPRNKSYATVPIKQPDIGQKSSRINNIINISPLIQAQTGKQKSIGTIKKLKTQPGLTRNLYKQVQKKQTPKQATGIKPLKPSNKTISDHRSWSGISLYLAGINNENQKVSTLGLWKRSVNNRSNRQNGLARKAQITRSKISGESNTYAINNWQSSLIKYRELKPANEKRFKAYTKITRSSRKSKTTQPVGQAMVAPKTQNRQKYIAPSSVTVNPLVQEINSKRNQTVLPKVSRIPGNTLQLQRKKIELKPSPSPQYHSGKSVFTILMPEPLISLVKSTIRRKKEETAKPEVTPKVSLIKNSLTHLTSVMPGKIMRKTAQAGTSSRRDRQSRLGSAHPSQVIPNLTLVLLNQKPRNKSYATVPIKQPDIGQKSSRINNIINISPLIQAQTGKQKSIETIKKLKTQPGLTRNLYKQVQKKQTPKQATGIKPLKPSNKTISDHRSWSGISLYLAGINNENQANSRDRLSSGTNKGYRFQDNTVLPAAHLGALPADSRKNKATEGIFSISAKHIKPLSISTYDDLRTYQKKVSTLGLWKRSVNNRSNRQNGLARKAQITRSKISGESNTYAINNWQSSLIKYRELKPANEKRFKAYTKTTRSSRKSKTTQPVGQAMVAPKTQNRQKYIAPSSVTVNPLVQEINSKRNQTVLPKVSRIPGNTLQLQRKKIELKPSPSPQYHSGKSVFTILMPEPLISLVKSTIRRKKEETAKPEVTPKVSLIKNSLTHLTSVMPGKIMRKTAQAGTSSRRDRQSRLGSAHPSQVIPNLTLVLLNQKPRNKSYATVPIKQPDIGQKSSRINNIINISPLIQAQTGKQKSIETIKKLKTQPGLTRNLYKQVQKKQTPKQATGIKPLKPSNKTISDHRSWSGISLYLAGINNENQANSRDRLSSGTNKGYRFQDNTVLPAAHLGALPADSRKNKATEGIFSISAKHIKPLSISTYDDLRTYQKKVSTLGLWKRSVNNRSNRQNGLARKAQITRSKISGESNTYAINNWQSSLIKYRELKPANEKRFESYWSSARGADLAFRKESLSSKSRNSVFDNLQNASINTDVKMQLAGLKNAELKANDIKKITDRVYREIQQRLKVERQRRGI